MVQFSKMEEKQAQQRDNSRGTSGQQRETQLQMQRIRRGPHHGGATGSGRKGHVKRKNHSFNPSHYYMLCKIYKKGEKIKIFSEEMIWNLLHLTTKKQNIKMKTKTKYKNENKN